MLAVVSVTCQHKDFGIMSSNNWSCWDWSTKSVISSTGIFVEIDNNNQQHFHFMPKIMRVLRSCSMKIL